MPSSNQDKNHVSYKGFSPGITFHYMLRLGKEHFTMSNAPALFGHYINFHGGIRPLFYNSAAGSGVMFEVGISYRLVYRFFGLVCVEGVKDVGRQRIRQCDLPGNPDCRQCYSNGIY